MAIPSQALIETLTDKQWNRMKDILYAPVDEESKRHLFQTLGVNAILGSTDEHASQLEETLVPGGAIKVPDLRPRVEATPPLRQGESGPLANDPRWIAAKVVAAEKGWKAGSVTYHVQRAKWRTQKEGRYLYIWREDYEASKSAGGGKTDVLQQLAARSAEPEEVETSETDVLLPFGESLDARIEVTPILMGAAPLPESKPDQIPEREESADNDPSEEEIFPNGKTESKLESPAEVELQHTLEDPGHNIAPGALRSPRPNPMKTEIAVGMKPQTRDPVLGDPGVHDIEGEIYVTGPLGASLLRMSTTQFNKSTTKGAPRTIRRHLEKGKPELFSLADLKSSVYYSTSGRTGF